MNDTSDFFRFKPIKAAKVSEVSEATASSDVPAEDRVNFHIGNPVQDTALSSAYLRLLLGIPITMEELHEDQLKQILDYLGLNEEQSETLTLLRSLIKQSAPYMPRGGFNSKSPHYLIAYFYDWLKKNQQEPLSYDLGESSGKREILLSSGGVYESVRILLHGITHYALSKRIHIFLYAFVLPEHLQHFQGLTYLTIPDEEDALLTRLHDHFRQNPQRPVYLFLGKNTSEICRRNLRQISLHSPLFFVEINDAANHLSLAREAKMMNRVLRILTPGIFHPWLKDTSVSFIAGNPEIIKIMETVQFQLKGTPSAAEITFLSFYLKHPVFAEHHGSAQPNNIIIKSRYEDSQFHAFGNRFLNASVKSLSNQLDTIIQRQSVIAEGIQDRIARFSPSLTAYAEKYVNSIRYDAFSQSTAHELTDKFSLHFGDALWQVELTNSFLYAFLRHHPEYHPDAVQLVSGSSRTGLGLLGFHCGITDVVFPDLSWTYEHCFPHVTVVPLTDALEIDVDGIIEAVKEKLSTDPNWYKYGAIVLNNPHNATGAEFSAEALQKLITWALNKNIIIIDDLSYQNVAPREKLLPIKTIRQHADSLAAYGYFTQEQANNVITVHSLSKTDSLAGARLSVIELRRKDLFTLFAQINSSISPNITAVLMTYLFYRNDPESVDAYWRLRNRIFFNRMKAIEEAVDILPRDRNVFDICIKPPQGSMYPQMIIKKLPDGLSLDWLASGLARQGIGLVPLSTFARTEKGFETARTTFRLTLGGSDNAETLLYKTRRVLIDLNRLIAEEASNYKRKSFTVKPVNYKNTAPFHSYCQKWDELEKRILLICRGTSFASLQNSVPPVIDLELNEKKRQDYIADRLSLFKQRFLERLNNVLLALQAAEQDKGHPLLKHLEHEFAKDNLIRKEQHFSQRLFDRTVHPTQMFSIVVENIFDSLIQFVITDKTVGSNLLQEASVELMKEFNGTNVAINSSQEPMELLLDLQSLVSIEDYTRLHADHQPASLLSFWGDWDGSNRPSGQGHSLIAAVLIENVARQAELLKLLVHTDPQIKLQSSVLAEIEKLNEVNKKFTRLLQKITQLTHQLEKRYRGILPFNLKPGKIRRFGMKLHVARDPLTSLWQHNDRLERKMIALRVQRKETLEFYFNLNKQLRKELKAQLPAIQKNLGNPALCKAAILFHDLMKRFVITPRIHQKMITAQDQFAIDTTVNNIYEINEIAAKYGNPGMVLALQISMSTKPEALIAVDRKLRTRKEQKLRENTGIELPSIWLIPLFEDNQSVNGIEQYLSKIWEYALQSRRLNQETTQRFAEILCEVFVAGSDLSQQVSQSAGMNLYKKAKLEVARWLAEKGLSQYVRMKMGSGEPMQRQGGYYFPFAGDAAFIPGADSARRFSLYLKASTKKSTEYAVTPMMGVFAGGDLRTFQSAISEKLRYLPAATVAQMFFHINATQKFYRSEILRAAEPLTETRLHFKTRGLKELERLTFGRKDALYEKFLAIVTENFRQILYGRDEDVVGIHIISYFIARTTPPLRDRPLIRPGQGVGGDAGRKILEKIAETIPLSRYGSLLRAIAHNQSQSSVLGISQLTTGLFRALDSFAQLPEIESEARTIIEDRILPNLPVYEILMTLRCYHDVELTHLNKIEKAFPAGNSAFLALREDIDAMHKYLLLFQRELLRRHGINVSDFFESDRFIPDLLPTLRPDLAMLLQPDIFNTGWEAFAADISGSMNEQWKKDIQDLLRIPLDIQYMRSKAWKLLEEPVYQRVLSFVELAIALYSLSMSNQSIDLMQSRQKMQLPSDLSNFYKSSSDDNMRHFLAAAFEYLSVLSEGMVEVPTNIIKALKEVERIVKIEEQALTPKQQELLRFYLLQIARLTGENG